jgi:dihydrofolate reductase
MRPLRFSTNITLDGCYDHRAFEPDEEFHHFHAQRLAQADALVVGRVTYQMMEEAWRPVARGGELPDWAEPWMVPFARTIDAVRKHVVSTTLERVDWNAELVRGDLATAINRLKQQPGKLLAVAGVALAQSLAELDLIDEYELVVTPGLAGHGPTLFAGLSRPIALRLVERQELKSGAVALRYEVRRE